MANWTSTVNKDFANDDHILGVDLVVNSKLTLYNIQSPYYLPDVGQVWEAVVAAHPDLKNNLPFSANILLLIDSTVTLLPGPGTIDPTPITGVESGYLQITVNSPIEQQLMMIVNSSAIPTPLTPGGANTLVQYNNGGVFGGIATGSSGQFLRCNGASISSYASLPAPTPASPDASVQFNNAGVLSGNTNLRYAQGSSELYHNGVQNFQSNNYAVLNSLSGAVVLGDFQNTQEQPGLTQGTIVFNGSTNIIASTSVTDPTSGDIGSAHDTVDCFEVIYVNENIAAQVLTLPTPGLTGRVLPRCIVSSGTESFTMYGVVIDPGQYHDFKWAGAAWHPQASL